MAKVTLKLDKRKSRKRKDGSFPLVIYLNHVGATDRISLKFSLMENQWDQVSQSPIDIPNAKHIGAKVRSQLSKAELLLLSIRLELDTITIRELKAMIQAEIFANDITTSTRKADFVARKINTSSITQYALLKEDRLRSAHRHGSADAIETAMNSLKSYFKKTDILFTEINVTSLKNYQAFCSAKGNKAGTVSAYLRQVRALFNEAIDETLIEDKLYPFKKFKLPKSPKTKNRALRKEEINAIRNLELKPNSALSNARDVFIFMFNNMGINFIDLVRLKKQQFSKTKYDQNGNLIEGRVKYDRSKTRNAFSIKLTPESLRILNEHSIASKKPSDFIFQYGFEDTQKGRERYKQQRKRLNRKLKELAQLAEIDEEITSYFARHSWATIAKRNNLPITLISDGLGHAEIRTTQIYLDSFDDDALDAANEGITGI